MTCHLIQDRLEAFIEQDLPEAEKRAVEDHLRTCPNCYRQWMKATEIRGALRSLPTQPCPSRVVREVLKRTRTERYPDTDDLRSFLSPLLTPPWRPVIALGLTILLVLILVPLHDFRPPEQPIYSKQEIQKAQEEIRWTLAYVHRVMVHTQFIVQEKVIPDQLVQPIRDSVDTAIESIKEGGKS